MPMVRVEHDYAFEGPDGRRSLLVYAEGGGIEGPSGTPTAGPTAQPGEGSDDRSRVIAIDLETRRPAWKDPYELEGIVEAAPVAEGGTIVLGDSAGTLVALDASTGAERWTADAGGEVLRPPAIADERVVLSLREGEEVQPTVSAFDLADGERVWSVQPSVAAANPFTTVPSIGDGLVFLGSFDRVTRALSLEDGTQRWTNEEAFRQFAPITVPAVAGEELYLADDAGGLHRYDAATGELVWSHALNAGVGFGAPVVVGDVVVLGLADGSLAAIDREGGELRSRVDAGDELGPVAVASELLVVARSGPGSGLVGFEHDPDTALTAIESPSQVRPGALLAMWAGGAAIVAIILLVPLRFVAGRTRPSPVQADAAEGPPPADEPPPDVGPVDDPAGGRQ